MNKSFKHSNWMIADDNYLCHHGIKGQKWGIRRFQNEDGSLTPEGMKRYGVDSNGNMSKRGAANYYRDIYNNSKSSGKRGQDLHDDVRSKFGSDEEYQAFVKNYKNHKMKKAAIGVGAGIAGAAATAAGIYGITRGVRAAQDKRLVNENSNRYSNMSMDDIVAFNRKAKEGSRTFNTQQMRKEAAMEARISEAIGKSRLKAGEKQWNSVLKGSRGEKESGKLDYQGIAERNIDRASKMATGTSLERAYKKSVEKMAGSAAKESLRETKKEFIGNMKIASLNQAKMNAGKEATANMVNSFSNSLIGKLTTGAGTMAGGVALGAAATVGKKVVTSLIDEQAGNNMFGGNYSKETKDKSSALTQPVTAQQAWKDRNKKKKEDED